jgi:hypothetical protein
VAPLRLAHTSVDQNRSAKRLSLFFFKHLGKLTQQARVLAPLQGDCGYFGFSSAFLNGAAMSAHSGVSA